MSDLDQNASQGVPDGEPVAQPDTTAPDPGQGQPREKSEAAAEPEQGKEPNEQPKAEPPWFVKRLEKQRQELADRDRRIAELEAARQPQNPGQDDPQQRGPSQADIDRMVSERAAQHVAQRAFDDTCNTIHDAGAKAYGDFGEALQTFRHLGGLPRDLIEAAAETGEAAKVLYELGKDPNEAERIMAMSPTRMAVAVAKIATRQAPAPSVSAAPPPIKLLAGSSRVETDPDKMSASEWKTWREKQLSH